MTSIDITCYAQHDSNGMYNHHSKSQYSKEPFQNTSLSFGHVTAVTHIRASSGSFQASRQLPECCCVCCSGTDRRTTTRQRIQQLLCIDQCEPCIHISMHFPVVSYRFSPWRNKRVADTKNDPFPCSKKQPQSCLCVLVLVAKSIEPTRLGG